MSRSIDLLVRKAWVTRESNPDDRRQVLLSLTDEGRAAHAAMVQHMQDAVTQLIEQLDDGERAKLYDGLSVLRTLLERAGADGDLCGGPRVYSSDYTSVKRET
jgi:DNA-binding MarR family transcriptional regulator